ncbi:MAG: nucleotidyltransferase family protein [Polyangiaceae bacterium]|nr:nucleotidyltransferase family protein [Polyangiaceae bacterium]
MALRFAPPPVNLSPELEWVLLRAYGPTGRRLGKPFAPDRATELARQFELGARIAARTTETDLRRELGAAGARTLAFDLLAATGRDRALMSAARKIAVLAAGQGIPTIWLKFAALRWLDLVVEGSRGATDIDILVRQRDAQHLHAALVRHGYTASDLPHSDHHLALLQAGRDVAVEIHDRIPGVRATPQGPSLTADELIAAGAAIPSSGAPGAAYVPTREFLVVHAMVHGYVQHGAAPRSYPLSRMFADLLDLGAGEQAWDLRGRARQWLRHAMADDEIAAVLDLAQALQRGADLRALSPGTAAGATLSHLVAGTLDRSYEESLKLMFTFRPVTDRRRVGAVVYSLRRALLPNDAQLDLLYGPATTGRARAVRRVVRPLDLGWRLGKYAWSYLRTRLAARRLRR